MRTERVTVALPADLLEVVDALDRDRSRFITQAVEHEVARRRRAALLESVHSPHPDMTEPADGGLLGWTGDLPDDQSLVDVRAGTPVWWVEGRGWTTEPE